MISKMGKIQLENLAGRKVYFKKPKPMIKASLPQSYAMPRYREQPPVVPLNELPLYHRVGSLSRSGDLDLSEVIEVEAAGYNLDNVRDSLRRKLSRLI